jgi:hypothetical protein
MQVDAGLTALILSDAELRQLTGYAMAGRQLDELHRQGFWRARRSRVSGAVILERWHYQAVCAGGAVPDNTPKVRPPQVRVQRRALA